MKLIIFGTTGGTGRQLVSQALELGHEVTAFARNPKKIDQTDPRLTVVKGDVLDAISVEHSIPEHDAVLCSLGMPNIMDKSRLRANGTKNIIQAMENSNIKRLVCQSALGTGDSYDLFPLHYRYFIVPLFMRRLYEDHAMQENHIKKSQLQWTIVRPGSLTDGKQTGVYKNGFTTDNKPDTLKISRADIANFMLKQLTDEGYLYKTPCVAY